MTPRLSPSALVQGWRRLDIRQPLPPHLVDAFVEFKDIKSIDRIQIAAWIGFLLTLCLFGLDYYRTVTGEFSQSPYYTYLFYFHLSGLLFLLPALHVTLHKSWIVATRLRRGIVIWGMFALSFVFVMGQSLFIFLHRGSLTMFLGYIFIASWMFAMSHRERSLFLLSAMSIMLWAIVGYSDAPTHIKIGNLIEIVFLSLVAFFFDAFDFNLKRTNFLNGIQMAREQERIRQLESFKSRFFTNLTHELRTPLTMILGMARQISEDPRKWTQEGTETIIRNSHNLLNLVNQILDISRIEQGAMPIHKVRGDVINYLGYVTDAFRGHAVARQITLHYLPRQESAEIDFDADACFAMLSNLLSNAIKFTPAGGHIYVEAGLTVAEDREVFELTVRDTGSGIPEEELPHIFERFYRGGGEQRPPEKGSGIGLALVQELVHMLHGEIQARSTAGHGAQFTVVLPVTRDAQPSARPLFEEDIRQRAELQLPGSDSILQDLPEEAVAGKPEVLLIEDNPEVIRYLQICLEDSYALITARNGEEGIRLATERVPALVLSDVMMPGTDGLAVCRTLKSQPATSHIPIVLLSAKADADSRIEGLQSGADVYMVKPFNRDELRIQLHNLMDRFRMLHQRYAQDTEEGADSDEAGLVQEDAFVAKVRAVIHEHLDDSDFSVSRLERAVFFSRSQLHKKLTALTGLSASRFILKTRLIAGRDKLRTSGETIADIAYQVGFSDPSHFTRCYVSEFGETPSETRKALQSS